LAAIKGTSSLYVKADSNIGTYLGPERKAPTPLLQSAKRLKSANGVENKRPKRPGPAERLKFNLFFQPPVLPV
jgi:hypothetical protein